MNTSEQRKQELENRPWFFDTELYVILRGICFFGLNNELEIKLKDYFLGRDNIVLISQKGVTASMDFDFWDNFFKLSESSFPLDVPNRENILKKSRRIIIHRDEFMKEVSLRFFDDEFKLIAKFVNFYDGQTGFWERPIT
ncbi:MAG: hypothetical protein ACYTXE_42635 [Nostoc sp.]